jgi:hypothetical protein
MKRKLTISASFQGVLPTGAYANMRPGFSAEEEFEFEDNDNGNVVINDIISIRQQELQAICFENFRTEADKARIMKIREDRKDFRFYTLPDGSEVPSVTSILNYDTDFLVPEDELKQYASQGNIIHAQVAEFIKTGSWKLPQEIEGLTPDLFILKSGSLKLSLDGWDFQAFLKKHPMEKLENGDTIINEKERYGGLPDGYSLFNGIPSIFDIKRTPEKTKNFMQMAAYAKSSNRKIGQMIIIPLNDKTEQGFSKPIISTDIDKYYELFLYKRQAFRKVYGI